MALMSHADPAAARPARVSRVSRPFAALAGALRRSFVALVDWRRRQAERCVARHMREMPDHVVTQFGLSPHEIARLRNLDQ
jgi:hypothetical protein